MIDHKNRHSRLSKTIAMGVVCLFLVNQPLWAFTSDALAPAGISKIETSRGMLEMMVKAYGDKKTSAARGLYSLSAHEPHLLCNDNYGRALRALTCPPFLTEGSVRIREAIGQIGPELTAYIREFFGSDEIEIAIRVGGGSTLNGYASTSSDADGLRILILKGSHLFEFPISSMDREKIWGEIDDMLTREGAYNAVSLEDFMNWEPIPNP